MAMYHSWDSQNAWLRQIHAHNYLFVNPLAAQDAGHRRRRLDVGGIAVGQGALHGPLFRGGGAGHGVDLERDRQGGGAWNLSPDANESQKGFPAQSPDLRRAAGAKHTARISNSDPITGQAAWYDVRVRIYKATDGESVTSPQFPTLQAAPGTGIARRVLAYFAGRKLKREYWVLAGPSDH